MKSKASMAVDRSSIFSSPSWVQARALTCTQPHRKDTPMARRTKGEGSAYMRKDGRAAASIMIDGKRITKYGKTKTEAMQKLQEHLDKLKKGEIVTGPKQTVEEYLTYWLENVHRLTIELTSLEDYRLVLRVHLLPAFGELQLAELTKERVQKFIAEKSNDGYAPAYIARMHAILSAALEYAVESNILSRNVCVGVRLPKKIKYKPHVLNEEQCKRLVAAARGHRLWFLILVAVTSGLRLGELLALHWDDFDMNNLRIRVDSSLAQVKGIGRFEKQPKTSSGIRRVVLTQVVIDAIPEQKEYIESVCAKAGSKWQEHDLVFPNQYGFYMVRRVAAKQLKAILKEAGLPLEVTPHDLRHSFATLLFAAGVNPKVVQEVLGHSNIATTLGMYGDVLPDMQGGVGAIVDRAFGS
jgi:integrase